MAWSTTLLYPSLCTVLFRTTPPSSSDESASSSAAPAAPAPAAPALDFDGAEAGLESKTPEEVRRSTWIGQDIGLQAPISIQSALGTLKSRRGCGS